jgi:hypothetical protein
MKKNTQFYKQLIVNLKKNQIKKLKWNMEEIFVIPFIKWELFSLSLKIKEMNWTHSIHVPQSEENAKSYLNFYYYLISNKICVHLNM